MRSIDFDEAAMERKIVKNIEGGFSLREILIKLVEESQIINKQIFTLEQRVVELSDQIDYVKEKMK